MNPTLPPMPNPPSIDPELVAAVREWTRGEAPRPAVTIEPRPDGVRVKMTYLGVETGILFAWGTHVERPPVQATLDRLFDVLSWRVTRQPQ
jgi:hypothetical protein